MTEAPTLPPIPDHLSTDPRSPHHNAAVFEHEIGIRLNGKERFDVAEYCIGEGWGQGAVGQDAGPQGQPVVDQVEGHGGGVLPMR